MEAVSSKGPHRKDKEQWVQITPAEFDSQYKIDDDDNNNNNT